MLGECCTRSVTKEEIEENAFKLNTTRCFSTHQTEGAVNLWEVNAYLVAYR